MQLDFFTRSSNFPFILKKLRLNVLGNALYKMDNVGVPVSGSILKEEYKALGQNGDE